ncbi:hypothetical protein GGI21_002315, partial [Coemansia aciculifera]
MFVRLPKVLPVASVLPSECLLLVLVYLWNDDYDLVTRFYDRRSCRSADYDQTRIHHVLRSRSISPLHVCHNWRQCAMPRYFRFTVVDLVATDRPEKQVPPWALPFVDRLFLVVSPVADDCNSDDVVGVARTRITNAQRLAHILPSILPLVKVLGLCSIDSQATRTSIWQRQQQPTRTLLPPELSPIAELGDFLVRVLPSLERIWFQSSDWVSPQARSLVRALTLPSRNGYLSCRVTAIHLASLSRRNAAAIDIIRQYAQSLEFLGMGFISGGILEEITHTTDVSLQQQHQPVGETLNGNEQSHVAAAISKKQVIYPALRRLLFAVSANAHIYANLPNYRACPFPSLTDLHFDDSLTNGLPREEWYAPLYDVFLKHAGMKLRHLTFPIVYNTQRTVSARNCPELVDLRHIKCCWATGPWSEDTRNESDSTRLLTAVTSIATLRRYIHPSYIARLSNMPATIQCMSLGYLDLYGWPLTLRNLAWVLRTFTNLTTLKVSVTRAIEWDDDRAQHRESARHSLNSRYSDREFADIVWSPVKQLAIGAADCGLALWEHSHLLDLLHQLMQLSVVSLYSGAYSYVKAANEQTCRSALDSGCYSSRLISAHIANLDSIGLSSQPIAEPVVETPSLHAITYTSPSFATRLASRAHASTTTAAASVNHSSNSWHLIHRL